MFMHLISSISHPHATLSLFIYPSQISSVDINELPDNVKLAVLNKNVYGPEVRQGNACCRLMLLLLGKRRVSAPGCSPGPSSPHPLKYATSHMMSRFPSTNPMQAVVIAGFRPEELGIVSGPGVMRCFNMGGSCMAWEKL